jgi:hypothetical protein
VPGGVHDVAQNHSPAPELRGSPKNLSFSLLQARWHRHDVSIIIADSYFSERVRRKRSAPFAMLQLRSS